MKELSLDSIEFGKPLPYALLDAQGQEVVAAGQIVSRRYVERLQQKLPEGVYGEQDDATGDADAPSPPEQSGHRNGVNSSVPVSALKPDTLLPADLYDLNRVLLLRAGSTITERFIEAICARGITEVETDAQAADQLTGRKQAAARRDGRPGASAAGAVVPSRQWVTEATAELDAIVGHERMPTYQIPPRVTGARPGLGLKELVRQIEIASEIRNEAAALFNRVAGDVRNDRIIDVSEVAAIVNRMQKCLKVDTRLASMLLNYQSSGDEYLLAHGLNVSWLVMAAGTSMGLASFQVREAGMGALFCDVGMLHVPDDVRLAARTLTEDERHLVERHPIHTVDILKESGAFSQTSMLVAYQSHERCDGTGYPRGLQRLSIHPLARLTAIADIYAAVTYPRPHRDNITPYEGMMVLLTEASRGRLDSDFVRVFLDCFTLFPIGSYVQLSDAAIARVIRSNGAENTRPVVVRIDPDGQMSEPEIDLRKDASTQIVEAISENEALKRAGGGAAPATKMSGAA